MTSFKTHSIVTTIRSYTKDNDSIQLISIGGAGNELHLQHYQLSGHRAILISSSIYNSELTGIEKFYTYLTDLFGE